ncbi:prokineticin-2 isoform X3 [Ochotona princeps]|uniref:prokineticin-2 isoform X3 n=1 Tax=Ochotona princeps TaxID=9978 RepID=UPI0027155C11|nr:prokineticin-2 isoform X3 [Ochotona princeps]
MRRPRYVPFLLLLLLLPALLLTPLAGDAAVITGACEKDSQCGGGMCCAVSIWVKSIRICTPMGKVGDSCHPLARKGVSADDAGVRGIEQSVHLCRSQRAMVLGKITSQETSW